jgi:hypothetical protein
MGEVIRERGRGSCGGIRVRHAYAKDEVDVWVRDDNEVNGCGDRRLHGGLHETV